MFNHKLLIKCIEHIESESSTEHWVHKSNQNCFWTLSAIKKTARIKWFLSKRDTKELLCGSDRWNDAFTGLSKKSDIQPPRLTPSITALTSIHDLNTSQWRSLWVSFKLRLDQNHQNQLRRSVLTINRPKPLRSVCCSAQMKQEVFYSQWIWRKFWTERGPSAAERTDQSRPTEGWSSCGGDSCTELTSCGSCCHLQADRWSAAATPRGHRDAAASCFSLTEEKLCPAVYL